MSQSEIVYYLSSVKRAPVALSLATIARETTNTHLCKDGTPRIGANWDHFSRGVNYFYAFFLSFYKVANTFTFRAVKIESINMFKLGLISILTLISWIATNAQDDVQRKC